MTLRLEKNEGSAWQAVDIASNGVGDLRMQVDYSQPTALSFTLRQPQHLTPIGAYAAVRFWDDAKVDQFGNPFASNNPAFLGFAEEIEPADSNLLEYTCYDPTVRASNHIPIMSTAWDTLTTQELGAVPRLVFNASIDNDNDWALSRGFGLTIGQMIAIILDDAKLPLEALLAAPATGPAYVASELEDLNYIPQEKIVFTGEPIRSGILRLLSDWAPEWRMLFDPSTRQWRFGNIRLSPQRTDTLNNFSAGVDHPVLKLKLDRSLDARYTAVKIYGPEAVENRDITASGGGLEDISEGPTLDTYGAGAIVEGKHRFRITDPDRRRMGPLLATPINAPSEETRIGPNAWYQFSMETRSPTVMVKYKNNNAGSDAWQTVTGWVYDSSTGIIDFGSNYLYRYNTDPQIEGGILQPNVEIPQDIRLVYPSYIEPLFVRAPASGYTGTAFTQHNLQAEYRRYDESLAVGFLRGTPVTSETRLEKFLVLANAILETKKDVLYHGGMTLEGIDYNFHLLGKRCNIAAVDGDGNTLSTGWEQIKALATSVEYDWEEDQTVVQFSSDEAEVLGFDPERIKEDLKVGAARISQIVTAFATMGTERRFTEWGTPYLAQSITVGGSITPVVVDPFFGTVDAVLG